MAATKHVQDWNDCYWRFFWHHNLGRLRGCVSSHGYCANEDLNRIETGLLPGIFLRDHNRRGLLELHFIRRALRERRLELAISAAQETRSVVGLTPATPAGAAPDHARAVCPATLTRAEPLDPQSPGAAGAAEAIERHGVLAHVGCSVIGCQRPLRACDPTASDWRGDGACVELSDTSLADRVGDQATSPARTDHRPRRVALSHDYDRWAEPDLEQTVQRSRCYRCAAGPVMSLRLQDHATATGTRHRRSH